MWATACKVAQNSKYGQKHLHWTYNTLTEYLRPHLRQHDMLTTRPPKCPMCATGHVLRFIWKYRNTFAVFRQIWFYCLIWYFWVDARVGGHLYYNIRNSHVGLDRNLIILAVSFAETPKRHGPPFHLVTVQTLTLTWLDWRHVHSKVALKIANQS